MTGSQQMLDREGRFTIHHMDVSDIALLAVTLSKQDLRELRLTGTGPVDALRHGYLIGSYVCRDGDRPVAAFGVNQQLAPAPVWFLGTDDRFDHPVAFVKLSRRWMQLLCAGIDCINEVPADHHETIRWLKSLDFCFDETPYTIGGHEFLRFSRLDGPAAGSPRH